MVPAHPFQSALSLQQLKFSGKKDNISGLQLADLLGHPVQHEQSDTSGLALLNRKASEEASLGSPLRRSSSTEWIGFNANRVV